MNKTERILACSGHIKYESIKNVVGCTEQLVYMVLKNTPEDFEDYKPRHRGGISAKKKECDFDLEKGMFVTISNSKLTWEVTFIGREVVSLKNSYDIKNVTMDKVKTVVE